jgi:hypothetical protein
LVIVFIVSGFHEAELPLDDALHLARMLAFMYSMLMAFVLAC